MGNWPDDYYRKANGPVTLGNKVNPFWWFGNRDDDIDQPKYDNRWPGKPMWLRKLMWRIRNPLCNFRRYVIGFWDKQDIWGPERWRNNPPNWNGTDTMWPLPGENVCIYFPYISFYLFGFKFLIGWKPNGEWGGPSVRKI